MRSIPKALLSLVLLASTNLVQAAPITLLGDHFSVTYDDAQAGLYGSGLVSGSLDTVYFLPTTFAAITGGGSASTQAALQLTLSVNPGYTFAGIMFAENGDYFLSNGGSVGASASLQALDPDTLAANSLVLGTGALGEVGGTTLWDLAGLLSPLGLGASQTLQVTLNNALTSAPTEGIGFVQKTYVGFTILTQAENTVPEPSGLALMLGGMLAAVLAGRRRRV
jgi:hypothetical protein